MRCKVKYSNWLKKPDNDCEKHLGEGVSETHTRTYSHSHTYTHSKKRVNKNLSLNGNGHTGNWALRFSSRVGCKQTGREE